METTFVGVAVRLKSSTVPTARSTSSLVWFQPVPVATRSPYDLTVTAEDASTQQL